MNTLYSQGKRSQRVPKRRDFVRINENGCIVKGSVFMTITGPQTGREPKGTLSAKARHSTVPSG